LLTSFYTRGDFDWLLRRLTDSDVQPSAGECRLREPPCVRVESLQLMGETL
jgi:hypothetical protein